MNILLVTENTHPFSGSSTQLRALARGLHREGHNVSLLYRLASSDPHSRALAQNEGPIRHFIAPFHREPELVAKICAANAIDVVHCHVEVLPQVIAALDRRRTPIVANYGSSWPLSRRILSSLTESQPRGFISVSDGGAALLASQLPDSHKPRVTVIRQSTELAVSSAEDKRIIQVTNEQPFALLLATFRTYKGIRHFCEAMEAVSRYRQLRGMVVGRYHSIQMQRLSAELGLPRKRTPFGTCIGSTTFVGPSQFAGSWTCRSTLSASASVEYEGIPGSLREAMLAGVPVIGTDIGYVRELIKPDWNGQLIPSRDSTALAKAMFRVLDERPTVSVYSARAKTFVRLFFSNASRIRRHLELYSRLGV